MALIAISAIFATERMNKQQENIETLTERVLLLESALSDKSGIKK